MAHTITPQVSESGEYLGSEIATHNGNRELNHQDDFVEQEDGSLKHIMANESDSQEDSNGFDFNEYLDFVVDLHPQLEAATDMADKIGFQYIDEWNALMNSPNPDLDRFNLLTDQILELYAAHTGDTESLDKDETESWFDSIDPQIVEDHYQQLTEAEYSFPDAQMFADAASEFSPGTVEHSILKAGVDIAFDKVSSKDAVDSIISQFGKAKALAAYMAIESKYVEDPIQKRLNK